MNIRMLHRKTFLIRSLDFKLPFKEMGYPFEEESTDLFAIDTKDIVDIKVTEVMAILSSTGIIHMTNFLKVSKKVKYQGFMS